MKKILMLLLFIPTLMQAQTRMINITSMGIPGPAGPTITPTVTTPLVFSNIAGTASSDITFTFVGALLTGSVTWTAASGMQVSTDGSTWSTTAVYTQSGGNASGTVHNRVAASQTAGSYSGSQLGTTPGLTGNVPVGWTATVSSSPTISLSPTSISGLNGVVGTAGTPQSYTLSYVGVSGVTVTSVAPVEISKDGGSTYGTTQSVLSTPTTMKARIASIASAGAVSINISHVASGATTQNEAVTGTVSSGTADSVQFMLTASSSPSPPAGVVRVAGDPHAGVVTASGGLSNSITFTSVATANWAQLSGTGCALDNGGKNSSTVPFMPDPSLRGIWFMFSSSGAYADSLTVTMAKPQIIIAGLNPSLTYKVYIGASLDDAQFALTCTNKFRIVGASTYISGLLNEYGNNTHPTAAEGPQFTSVTPNASGQLKFYFFTEPTQEVATVGTIKIVQN